jgi:ankyrin repeat protein
VKSIHYYFWDFCSEKNHHDNTGLTPLPLAICKFDTFVLQFVLHFDILIQQNPKNQDGLSPHHLAVVYGQFRMFKCCPVISTN